MKVSDFHYDLPEDSIAQSAIEPRHASRLLDTRDMTDHVFLELPDLLEPGDLVVVNETRVRAARLIGVREETGGRVEFLILERNPDGTWQVLARPSRRLRPGIKIRFEGFAAKVLTEPAEGVLTVGFDTEDAEAAIDAAGIVPLPPYFVGTLDDRDRYQTTFATTPGSAAAPTAGLHFTEEVFDGLAARGIEIARVDLHVSLDTFRPMVVETIEDHSMHSEWCSVPETTTRAVERTRRRGGRVIAIGTTVVRTLESMADERGGVTPGSRRTDLFLKPGSVFRVVDGLVTNFHMPSSTLLVLLAAFMGHEWRNAYEAALSRDYRFLSFGDAMLCFRAEP